MCIRDLGDLIVLILIFVWIFCVGAMISEDHYRREAVAAGVAHWAVDTEGKVSFKYNK